MLRDFHRISRTCNALNFGQNNVHFENLAAEHGSAMREQTRSALVDPPISFKLSHKLKEGVEADPAAGWHWHADVSRSPKCRAQPSTLSKGSALALSLHRVADWRYVIHPIAALAATVDWLTSRCRTKSIAALRL